MEEPKEAVFSVPLLEAAQAHSSLSNPPQSTANTGSILTSLAATKGADYRNERPT
jgi:hypothetical protein